MITFRLEISWPNCALSSTFLSTSATCETLGHFSCKKCSLCDFGLFCCSRSRRWRVIHCVKVDVESGRKKLPAQRLLWASPEIAQVTLTCNQGLATQHSCWNSHVLLEVNHACAGSQEVRLSGTPKGGPGKLSKQGDQPFQRCYSQSPAALRISGLCASVLSISL